MVGRHALWAWVGALCWAAAAQAALPEPGQIKLKPTGRSGAVVVEGVSPSPVELSARSLTSVLDEETRAEGDVELRRAGLVLSADSLRYLQPSQLAIAQGHVRLERNGDVFSGSQAQVWINSRQGFMLDPYYHFQRTGASGKARRIDFSSSQQVSALGANYSSCPRPVSGEPDWVLHMDRLDLNFDTNEGRAEGAVLRFLGVPILAVPVMTFPATEAPKSGWLPPTINIDSRGGFETLVPYYWRLAPNRDLTLTPTLSSRRGVGLLTELRYLEAADRGRLELHTLPDDRVERQGRYSMQFEHEGQALDGWLYRSNWQQASDDIYWKDFSRYLPSITPRLLPQDMRLDRQWDTGAHSSLQLYGRVQGWQALQDPDVITTPYQRMPQMGARWTGDSPGGLRYDLEVEANRFELRERSDADTRVNGDRLHFLGSVARPVDLDWGWITPRLTLNSASYATDSPMDDGRNHNSRTIPTLSLDAGLRLERHTAWFDGSPWLQTLEPRLHLLNTPRRAQAVLPTFDSAASDFNEISIYADNAFTGVDRVSDARQLTFGATSRLINPATGVEALSFGAAQRYQFREQQLSADGVSNPRRFSDVLMFASGTPLRDWRLDTTVQYNTDISRAIRSIVALRYQPQPYHTLAATYRFARDLSEQMELGWQWPLYRGGGTRSGQTGECGGTLYGVGRVNYSIKDNRTTDSLVGMEYDAGCWILRFVVQRESTAFNETTTRRMLQLELVGLSRLGSNPLQVLKDNIPGYRLLRDDSSAPSTTVNP